MFALGTAVLMATQAQSQVGVFKNFVGLQPTSPGTAQSGHVNVVGIVRAGGFSGNGSMLTNVDANLLGGNPASSFMPANPVPLSLSGSPSAPILSVNQLMGGEDGILSSSPSGNALYVTTVSGYGVNAIAGTGTAVEGSAGSGIGLRGSSNSASGFGVTASNTGGGYALSVGQKSRFFGELQLTGSGNLSIRAGEGVFAPITMQETDGAKIALNGGTPTAFNGISLVNGDIRIHNAIGSDSVGIGFGSGASYVERVQFTSASEMIFRPDNFSAPARISSPLDFWFFKDRDANNSFSDFSVFTNGPTIEQMRIQDGDEAATLFDGAVTANGINFAEGFKVHDPSLEPGDLVVNSGANWEYIGRSSQPYQAGVIGVISTKPAFVAGMSFNAEDAIDPALTRRRDEARRKGDFMLAKELTVQMRRKVEEAYRPVAFMGRVPVKVVGPVKVGDKLTASSIPGVAMAMTKGGHSIGIALEASAGGQTKVMAMIQPGLVAGPDVASNPTLIDEVKDLRSENARLRQTTEQLQARLDRLEQLIQSARGR